MIKVLLPLLLLSISLNGQYSWEPTWGPVNAAFHNLHVTDSHIYGVADGHCYSSTDGKNWTFLKNLTQNPFTFTHLNSDGNRLYAFGHTGFKYSDDKGATWTQDTLKNITRSFVKGSEVYCATPHHLFYSPDSGTTLQSLCDFDRIEGITVFQNKLYVYDYYAKLYTSTDKGQTWTKIYNPTEGNISFSSTGLFRANHIHNDNEQFLYISGVGGIQRMDPSGNWTDITPAVHPTAKMMYSLKVDANNIYAASANTSCYTTPKNNINWTTLPRTYITQLDIAAFNGLLITAGNRGLNFSSDGGNNWQQIYKNIQAGTWNTNIEETDNGLWSQNAHTEDLGDSWQHRPINDTLNCRGFRFGNMFASHKDKYTSQYVSFDWGMSWQVYTPPSLPSKGGYGPAFNRDIIFTSSDGNTVKSYDAGKTWHQSHNEEFWSLVGLDSLIFITTTSGLYRSADDGQSWQQLNTGLQPDGDPLWVIYAGKALYLQDIQSAKYRSADMGATWTKLPETGLNVYMRTCIAANEERVFVSGYNFKTYGFEERKPIYELVLGDSAWHVLINDPVPTTDHLLVKGNYLFASFGNQGIQRLQLGPASELAINETGRPGEIFIYPNPSDAVFTIVYKEEGKHSLQLFDCLGSEVRTVSSGNETKTLSCPTSDLPAGIYFIKSDSEAKARKIIVRH